MTPIIKLHILNAHGKFSPFKERIEAVFTETVAQVLALIPLSGVDVVVYLEPTYTIPAFGLGGHAPSGSRVMLAADPENKNFERGLSDHFKPALAHELHHCKRWQTVGYGETLLEALVSEGLACHFETELTGKVPFYASALDKDLIPELLEQARQSFSKTNYTYARWFFGDDELPFYTGYALGFELLERYLSQYGKKASTLYAEPAESFLNVV